jgi:hypothetical protein
MCFGRTSREMYVQIYSMYINTGPQRTIRALSKSLYEYKIRKCVHVTKMSVS